MKSIAINEFEDIQMHESLRKQLIGPVIVDKGNFVEFKWYKVLEWGDTSALYIDVYKKLSTFSWRDYFFYPKITMNYQWYYFLFPNGIGKFQDVLPEEFNRVEVDSLKYKPYDIQNDPTYLIDFIVVPERLFYFLQKGHFTVVEKNSNFTLVDFYEPIGTIVHKQTNDTTSTMSAKVFLEDSLQVVIIPYDVPIEFRNKQ